MSDKTDLPWKVILEIWWAQTWRFYVGIALLSLLIAFIGLMFGGTAKGLQHVLDTESNGLGVAINLGLFALWFAVQLWALRESLADRYRSFTIRLERRSHK